MEGYQVTTMDDAAAKADIFVTATGNVDVITLDHMRQMKDRAIVCNIGHFDSEIQIDSLRNYQWEEVKPQVDEVDLPGRQAADRSGQGPAGQSRLRHRPSELRDERVVHQPGAGADRAVDQSRQIREQGLRAAEAPGREGGALHLAKLGAKLTKLSPTQAGYIGVAGHGPYKPEHYRY